MNQERLKQKLLVYRKSANTNENDAVYFERMIAFNGESLLLRTVHYKANFALVASGHKKKERVS